MMSNASLLSPDEACRRLKDRVPRHIRWTFVASVIFGLLAHFYMFTNKLPNHDDIHHLFNCDYGTESGRWLLPYILQLDGDFSMPWLIGVLGILCLAGTACLTVSLFEIRRPIFCVLTAAVMVSFPTVTSTFTYMFTADAYLFGLFLAALGAYATVRGGILGIPFGAVAVICSMGIYQSYFPVAVVLMLGALIIQTIKAEYTFLELVVHGVKYVTALTLGILVYMAVARFMTRNIGLSDYMGISSMGSLSLADLPNLIRLCYESYEDYFFLNEYGWYFDFLNGFLKIGLLCTILLLLLLIFRRKVGVLRGLLALVLVVLYPLAGNLIHIMVSGADVHFLMIYGAVYVLVLPLALASVALKEASQMGVLRRGVQCVLSWVLIIILALTSYSYIVADNKAYVKMEVGFEQITAYSNRLVAAIEQSPDYSVDVPVFLVGTANDDPAFHVTPELDEIFMTGIFTMGQYRSQYSYPEFLYKYLAFPNRVYTEMSDESMESFAESAEIQALPSYPAEGSIALINGYLVVKLS